MPLSSARSAVDSLGRRLARAATPDPGDLRQLAELQYQYQPALGKVGEVVRELVAASTERFGGQFAATSRTKTVGTIIDKVRRGTRLSSMQDIVGFRIAADQEALFALADQDWLAARVVEAFPGARVVDRRAAPTAGYRAMHVIPVVGGVPVEVQIRTVFQDLWANQTEALGDAWGRGIRYGLPPEGRDQSEVRARSDVLLLNLAVADRMHELEVARDPLFPTLRRLLALDTKILNETATPTERAEHERLSASALELDKAAEERFGEVRDAIDEFRRAIDRLLLSP